jgi:uncharacterized membrane protein YjdF
MDYKPAGRSHVNLQTAPVTTAQRKRNRMVNILFFLLFLIAVLVLLGAVYYIFSDPVMRADLAYTLRVWHIIP